MDARDLRARQRGQTLVIFAGSLLLLLLIAALVFDLGMSFMQSRQEQNAVDPGAIAAAQYIPSYASGAVTDGMKAAACFYARQDGFFPSATKNDLSTSGCVSTNDPGRAILTVNYPPVGASAGAYEGRPGFVQVLISRQHQNFFLGILGQPFAAVSAQAIAAYTTGDSNSYSLLALDPNDDQLSGQIGGTGGSGTKVSIVPAINPTTSQPYSGGYVQVNSTYPSVPAAQGVTCPTGNGAFFVNGGGSITAPQISVTGQCGVSNNATVTTNSGLVDEGALQVGDPLSGLEPPDPRAYPAGTCGSGGATSTPTSQPCGSGSMKWQGTSCTVNGGTSTCVSLQPGVYYGGWTIGNNITLTLAAGIYIMAGGGISVSGSGAITSVAGSSGSAPAPVMIYSTDNPTYQAQCLAGTASAASVQCQRALNLDAQSTLDLAGMNTGQYKGILLWQDGAGSCTQATNTCNVTLGGQTNLNISGTVYAPKVQVTLDGGGSVSGVAAIQIISWQWTIIGGSQITMPYDPNQLYHLEQRGLVH